MLGRGAGLTELVQRARDSLAAFFRNDLAASSLADEVQRYVFCGAFRLASIMATPEAVSVPAPSGLLDCPDDAVESLDWIASRAEWWIFAEAVFLADEIDSFLAVLEVDKRTAPLARDCRNELDLLLVLADLCADVGLPAAAAEARYKHELAWWMCWEDEAVPSLTFAPRDMVEHPLIEE